MDTMVAVGGGGWATGVGEHGESAQETTEETSGGETMLQGQLSEEKIEETSQGKDGRQAEGR